MVKGFDEWGYFKARMRERWERFEERYPVRRKINEHPKLVVLISLICGLMLLWILVPLLFRSARAYRDEVHKQVYFFDLNTGQLFTASARAVPPIEAPSGPLPDGEPAGVRAHVFSYRNQDGQEKLVIGWLEKRNPTIREEVYLESRTARGENWGRGMLIKRMDGSDWIQADSPEGLALVEAARRPDASGKSPVPAFPK